MPEKGSLWSELSASARLELIPIISTAVLVEGGEATADALVRLAHLKPFGGDVSEVAIIDVTGMLLLINLAVVLWFAYLALKGAVAAGEEIKKDAKVVGLGTAFLTTADLVTYGVKFHHPERTIYALLVLLFLFVVPFFLIKRRTGAEGTTQDEGDVGRHALGAITLVANAILPTIAAVVVASLYEVAWNDGVGPLPSFLISVLGQTARSEFWGVSPGIVGIVWAPLLLSTYRWIGPGEPSIDLGMDRRGVLVLALACAGAFIAMALVLINDDTLLLVPPAAGITQAMLSTAKAGLGLLIAVCYVSAFLLLRALEARQLPTITKFAASLAILACGGMIVGASIVAIRLQLAGASPHSVALILLHGGGFVVAFGAGRLTLWLLRREFSNLAVAGPGRRLAGPDAKVPVIGA